MKYQRYIVKQAGEAHALHQETVDLPTPQADEILVKVHSAGVAFADTARRSGAMVGSKFPYYPGYDFVGDVVAIGDEVNDISIGTRVAGLCMDGGYSEYLCVPAYQAVVVEDDALDSRTISAMLLNYYTAYQILFRVAGAKAGDSVLVHGAAGGLGTAVIQLAVLHNIRVYGTASKHKHSIVSKLGGIPIDYHNEDFVDIIRTQEPAGLTAVFDPIGGRTAWRSASLLKRDGTHVVLGILSAINGSKLNAPATFALMGLETLLPKRKAVFYGASNKHAHYHDDLKAVLALLSDGGIQPIIAGTLAFEDAPLAHQKLEDFAVIGKLVMDVG